MVQITAAVEHDPGNPLRLRSLGYQLTHFAGALCLGPRTGCFVERRGSGQGMASLVVDDLNMDVGAAAEDV
jgi:hypothetical protein